MRAATAAGQTFRVRARTYVLAAGAIENARLLLLRLEGRPDGVGNEHGNAGRCFMDHQYVVAGELVPADSSLYDRCALYDLHRRDGAFAMGKLQLSEPVRREHGLLNANARLEPVVANGLAQARAAARRLTREPRALLRLDGRAALPVLARQALQMVATEAELAVAQRRPRRPGIGGWSRLRFKGRRLRALRVVVQAELRRAERLPQAAPSRRTSPVPVRSAPALRRALARIDC